MNRIISLICVVFLVACGQPQTTSAPEKPTETIGTSETVIRLNDLKGKAIQRSKDKFQILNLWATWCKPCIEEMPALERMAKQLPDQFEVILASEEDLKRINAFVSARSLALTFAQLESGLDGLGVYSLPTTLIIGPDGQTIETIVGARTWDSPEQINHLLSLTK